MLFHYYVTIGPNNCIIQHSVINGFKFHFFVLYKNFIFTLTINWMRTILRTSQYFSLSDWIEKINILFVCHNNKSINSFVSFLQVMNINISYEKTIKLFDMGYHMKRFHLTNSSFAWIFTIKITRNIYKSERLWNWININWK